MWVCPGLLAIVGAFLVLTAERLSPGADDSAPADFRRFDVGAFVLTFLWAFPHGLFRWAGAFLLLDALFGILFNLVREVPSVELHLAYRATRLVLWFVFAFVFARRARSLHWRSMRASDAEPENLASRIERIRRGRVYWFIAGAIVFVLTGYAEVDRWVRLIR